MKRRDEIPATDGQGDSKQEKRGMAMKKGMGWKIILPTILILAAFNSAQAQGGAARRIHFQRGHSSATVNSTVTCGQTITYLVGAKSGQKMSVHLSGKGAAFRLSTPSGGNLEGGKAVNNATEDLDESGDYRIVVECWKQRSSAFSMEVVVQ
jgi:hypothetical protein